MQAKQGDTVKVNYVARLDDGTIVDTSEECGCDDCDCEEETGPLSLTLGEEEIVPGLEQAIIGMQPGEKKTVRLTADEAYGPYDEELVMEVPTAEFPEDINPEVGQTLELTGDDGESFLVTVTDVSDELVILDANHPLAGKDLTYEVELVEIG